MQKNDNQQLEEIEEKLRRKTIEEKKNKQKVSGKSVFELQRIISDRSKAHESNSNDTRKK